MKLLIDMNLSPEWVRVFERQGWQALHWASIGDPRAEDPVIVEWARVHEYIAFTHDLDFGTLPALTRAIGPSVVQIRTQDTMPEQLENLLVPMLRQHEAELDRGALMTLDEAKSRIRILPF